MHLRFVWYFADFAWWREAERGRMEEKIIGGRYVYKRALGKGGNGSVFLCQDIKLQKEWAVKELKIVDENSSELHLLKTISSNRFPRIVDVVYEQNMAYLIMDYVEGSTLAERMKGQKLTEQEVLPWAVEIAKALNDLHLMSPRILYMDCKPENIMLTPQGEIRLVDLGSVYICQEGKKQRISGTRFFASGERRPDVRSDIYAFGMTLYYLLAGEKKIYRRKGRLSIKAANPAVSEGMNAIIARCTQTDPDKRPQSMEEVLFMLTNSKQIHAQEKRKKRFGKMAIFFVKCVCACTILAGAWLYTRLGQEFLLAGSVVLFVILLFLCRRNVFCVYEVKKEVFCGSGKRVLLYILVIFGVLRIMTISVFAKESKAEFLSKDWVGRSAENSQAEECQKLNVTIYDQMGRKLLLQDGAVWKVSEDILLSIPLEELNKTYGIITLSYEDKENGNVKKYSFSCWRK